MRRGHPGIGGWRSENPRHFRPRGAGLPHFGPTRGPRPLEIARFPSHSVRTYKDPQPYNLQHSGPLEDYRFDRHANVFRSDHRHSNHHRSYERSHHQSSREKSIPFQNRVPNDRPERHTQYGGNSNMFEKVDFPSCRINSMGDMDFRHPGGIPQQHDSHRNHDRFTWARTPGDGRRHYFNDKNINHPQEQHQKRDEIPPLMKIPILDHTGHRPPTADQYGGNLGSVSDNNSKSFSRSIDDTVDIVRKRLLSRNESQQHSDDQMGDENERTQDLKENSMNNCQNSQQEQPVKKKTHKQKQSVITNCDKIKNKIVHQLFKMDKDRIHKLLDHPNSSTKFEYAISSLITESQNSLNRHLRSVAEKSLSSSSTDLINNDTNTIYEDTFMKQMQGILEPQDTVFLEDMKPLVMAELCKVLQLNDLETVRQLEAQNDPDMYHPTIEDQTDGDNYYKDLYNYEEFSRESFLDQSGINYDNLESVVIDDDSNKKYEYNQIPKEEIKPLFERRSTINCRDYSENRRSSSETQRLERTSLDNRSVDIQNKSKEEIPLFEINAAELSEEDDTFAELDKQYHVAVDHHFIEADYLTNTQLASTSSCNNKYQHNEKELTNIIEANNISLNIKRELDDKLQHIANSTLELSSINYNTNVQTSTALDIQLKQEVIKSPNCAKEIPNNNPNKSEVNSDIQQSRKCEKSQEATKSSLSKERKRSSDQRPSHRKEKRKKSDSLDLDKNKTENTRKSEKHDTTQSNCNISFSKSLSENEASDAVTSEKGYSDKYVRRKSVKTTSKQKGNVPRKKHNSTSSTHSILSSKDCSATTSKSENKTKLKTIDMFVEKPRKSSLHHAHRNTASIAIPNISDLKTKQPKRHHVATQVIKQIQTKETQTFETKHQTTRFSQTERYRLVTRAIQTDPVSFEKSGPRPVEPFERMKEIDLEIQVLLQEKFKLYSSLESKDPCSSSMQTLGMTVLNVSSYDDSKKCEENNSEEFISEDAIVDDFTNIPVEELEQIAFESIESSESSKDGKRSRRKKVLEQETESPTIATAKRSNRKVKSPNISLIEQIITDSRPLEDIISLAELEKTPIKPKRKTLKIQQKSKKKTKKTIKTKPVQDAKSIEKECCVVLIREDLSRFLNSKFESFQEQEQELSILPIEETSDEVNHDMVVEETVVNDVFDMLDVSEDIVIGDNYEVKSVDKDSGDQIEVINEEIILDNSQSSMEDATSSDLGQKRHECKLYDFSSDEKLRRDTVTVSGNGDAILAIECVENDFIAASLDGNVYHFNSNGQLLNTLRGSNLPVTCLTIVKEKYGTAVYTGSLDSRIRCYDLDTGLEKGPECNVLSPIQTMDRAWDTVFVGTRTGFVLQFECKNNMLIPVSTVKFSEQSILALRAIKEGPRKVLLVAARTENVTIKDAQTGLLLRTLSGPKMTVYTLLFEEGKVYCGTSSHQIHVFDYSSGSHLGSHEGGKGAVCLRSTGGLLFAGCYDGCVYVYREGETKPLAQLRGPSNMLLSLAIIGSKIIAGYKDRSLYIWKMPLSILQEMIL